MMAMSSLLRCVAFLDLHDSLTNNITVVHLFITVFPVGELVHLLRVDRLGLEASRFVVALLYYKSRMGVYTICSGSTKMHGFEMVFWE